jgi:hypothetical protein
MSNHYHLVVHINRTKAEQLSHFDVIQRWGREHQLPPLILRYAHNQLINPAEIKTCEQLILTWRKRLYSLSWLMKELNFDIARQANREDGCTGHFWEGRFKSQALLNEKALLAAMAYTDLNPVRAGVSPTPETSEHTSFKKRLDTLDSNQPTPVGLFPFKGDEPSNQSEGIPFRLMDYIEWVDWVGRHIRQDKPGYITTHQPEILNRLNITQRECLRLCTGLERKRYLWIGSANRLHHVKRTLNRKRLHGMLI